MSDRTKRPLDAGQAEFEEAAKRARFMVRWWSAMLAFSSAVGKVRRVRVDVRVVASLLLLGAAIVFSISSNWTAAAAFGVAWVGLLLLIALSNTRGRFIIGEFNDGASSGGASSGGASSGGAGSGGAGSGGEARVDLSKLLLVELSRLGDLFRVVGDQRAVSSEFSHQRALDATLSVDALTDSLQGTVSADTKIAVGPISIPLAPFIALLGKVLQSPRLTGDLHRDGGILILTAQTSGQAGLTWRVEAHALAEPTAQVHPVLSGMVKELALRIYTDLSLGRAVRWKATEKFVEGLHRFRASLRTPKDRKVNLQRVEGLLLESLAEDEDFPLAYYNLGVVYTELHGLAVAAGRTVEAKARLSAAEVSFGRAIEKDSTRWECYFAYAQTQFRYGRYVAVTELCEQMLTLGRSSGDRAKTHELYARALDRHHSGVAGYREALKHARQASSLALRRLVVARLMGRPAANGSQDREQQSAALASGCLLTFSDIVSRQLPDASKLADRRVRGWYARRIQRRTEALTKLAPLAQGKDELRNKLGRRALEAGYYELAESELGAAVRTEPTRAAYCAGLALAIATRLRSDPAHPREYIGAPDRDEIEALCVRALHAMAGAFAPSRDVGACETVADAYERMNSAKDHDAETEAQLRRVAKAVNHQLERSEGAGSVSGAFLEALQSAQIPLSSKIGDYGEAAHDARINLVIGQDIDEKGTRALALDAFRKALELAEKARSLNPLSTLAWETLGDVHRELSDFQNARFAWEQALATDPDNPRLYDKIGSSYWQIADDGRTGSDRDELEIAAERFDNALTLYPRDSFDERILTHYRLGKLNASLRNFLEAKRHLEIVEAVGQVPVLGWDLLGFAYLEHRNFTEAEYYFNRVVKEGDLLADSNAPEAIVGDRLDEQHWPLNLIRAWGHVGLAISHIERDGSVPQAEQHLACADDLLRTLNIDLRDPARDPRFPTRAPATIMECRGRIFLRRREVDNAVAALERAVSCFPHSRSYYGLALALEEQATRDESERREIVSRALRVLGHATSLRAAPEPSEDLQETMTRLKLLGGGNGVR